jgi:hypothetical protein
MEERRESDAEAALGRFESRVAKCSASTLDALELERELQSLLNARGQEVMAELLRRADSSTPEVTIDGERWGNRQVTPGVYRTVFGPVEIERSVYQRSGRGRVAVPLDLRLGIVERAYTPAMARVMTRATALMTDADAEGFLAEVGTAVVSKATLNRVPRAIAARYETHRTIVDEAIRARDEIPDDAVTIQVGMDGVMVPQDGEHARARGRTTKSPEPPRHELRYGPVGRDCPADDDGKSGRAWHEGSVGTVAFFRADGERLKTIYLARMPEACKVTLVSQLTAEVNAIIEERPDLNIIYASDGAPLHWSAFAALDAQLPASATGDRMSLVDAFHVAEYIGKAANAVEGTGTAKAAITAATWRETTKTTEAGPATVLRSMRARRCAVRSATRVAELDTSIDYLANQLDQGRMKYAEAIAKNYPIGSGITEAAAKTVVGTRMKRAGARFSQHGGQTIMLFRTAILSERFEALHQELHKTYTKSVRVAA